MILQDYKRKIIYYADYAVREARFINLAKYLAAYKNSYKVPKLVKKILSL